MVVALHLCTFSIQNWDTVALGSDTSSSINLTKTKFVSLSGYTEISSIIPAALYVYHSFQQNVEEKAAAVFLNQDKINEHFHWRFKASQRELLWNAEHQHPDYAALRRAGEETRGKHSRCHLLLRTVTYTSYKTSWREIKQYFERLR